MFAKYLNVDNMHQLPHFGTTLKDVVMNEQTLAIPRAKITQLAHRAHIRKITYYNYVTSAFSVPRLRQTVARLIIGNTPINNVNSANPTLKTGRQLSGAELNKHPSAINRKSTFITLIGQADMDNNALTHRSRCL